MSDYQPLGASRASPRSRPGGWGQMAEVGLVGEQVKSAICPQRMDLRSEHWGQIVDETLFPFRITPDNLTPATPPMHPMAGTADPTWLDD